MDLLAGAQSIVLLVLSLAALLLTGYAFVDALRRPAGAFEYAGKRTKTFWTVLLGVALAVSFVSFGGGLGLFMILPVVAAGIYLADVRPAVSTYRGGPSSGPYGGY